METQPVRAFCIPGSHAADEIIGTTTEGVSLSAGWSLVRASKIDGRWVEDPTSPAKVVVCAAHRDGMR